MDRNILNEIKEEFLNEWDLDVEIATDYDDTGNKTILVSGTIDGGARITMEIIFSADFSSVGYRIFKIVVIEEFEGNKNSQIQELIEKIHQEYRYVRFTIHSNEADKSIYVNLGCDHSVVNADIKGICSTAMNCFFIANMVYPDFMRIKWA